MCGLRSEKSRYFGRRELELGHIAKRSEYEQETVAEPVPLPEEQCDYDKHWADWMDLAPAVVSQLLVPTKA